MRRLFPTLIFLIAVCTNVQAAILDFVCNGDTISIELNAPLPDTLSSKAYLNLVNEGYIVINMGDRPSNTDPYILEFGTPIHLDVDPDSLGLDSLLVRDSNYRLLLRSDDPRQGISVKDLLTELNYTYQDSVASSPIEYGSFVYIPLALDHYFIVTISDGAGWLDGRAVCLGKVIKGLDILQRHQVESLPIDALNIRE